MYTVTIECNDDKPDVEAIYPSGGYSEVHKRVSTFVKSQSVKCVTVERMHVGTIARVYHKDVPHGERVQVAIPLMSVEDCKAYVVGMLRAEVTANLTAMRMLEAQHRSPHNEYAVRVANKALEFSKRRLLNELAGVPEGQAEI